MRKFFRASSVAALLFLVSQSSFASTVFDWTYIKSTDVQFIKDAPVQFEFTLNLIKNAKESIDFATYHYDMDPLGIEILKELREAANRGVKVRFVRGSFLPKLKSQLHDMGIKLWKPWTLLKLLKLYRDDVADFLLATPTKEPIEYIYVSTWMLAKGWSVWTSAHQKFWNFDAGLPERKIGIITGRNISFSYTKWFDLAYVLKGDIVDQLSVSFQDLWDTLKNEVPVRAGKAESKTQAFQFPKDLTWKQAKNLGEKSIAELADKFFINTVEAPEYLNEKIFQLNKQEKSNLAQLNHWAFPNLFHQAGDAIDGETQEYFRARIINHNPIQQIRTHCPGWLPWFYGYHACMEKIEDPIVDTVVDLLQDATEVRIYTLSTIFQKKLFDVLLARLQNSKNQEFHLKIITNGKKSHSAVLAPPVAWTLGHRQMTALLKAGAKISTFRNIPRNHLVFSHAKGLSVIGPRGSHTFTGSSNFTKPSSLSNTEKVIHIESESFAKDFNRGFDEAEKVYLTRERSYEEMRKKKPFYLPDFLAGIFENGV